MQPENGYRHNHPRRQDGQARHEPSQNASQNAEIARRRRITWEGQVSLIKLTALLAIIWVLFFALIGITSMPNGDMEPNVDMGDMMLFYRLGKDVKPQDVVIVNKEIPEKATGTASQGERNTLTALRVIAVAGDTVSVKDGCVYVNGSVQVEGNIFYPTQPYEGYGDEEVTLREGQCYVLGDHRNGAMDSRVFGAIDTKDIVGTVLTIIRRNNI